MSSSAETVAEIEELLKQILVRVPALSLLRFKCVSKHWLSLISHPDFRRRHTLQNPNPKISAFFNESFKSFPLNNRVIPPAWNPFKTLTNSVPDGSKLRILQSCNGLFLCHVTFSFEQRISFKQTKHYPVYVVNPTTNQFLALSSPNADRYDFVRYALAFDPSKSPHYKVVCVTNYPHYYEMGQHNIDIYSSETGVWKHLQTPFFRSPSDEGRHPDFIQRALHFGYRSREGAVYCNGSVHWIRASDLLFCSFEDGRQEFVREETDVLHYFDISQERLLVVSATPPVSSVVKNIPMEVTSYGILNPTTWPQSTQRYFGECGGCLYLIDTYKHCMTQFDVMEVERDYSGWFVKYRVDLNPLVAALPGHDWSVFFVLCLSQEEETIQESGDDVEGSSIDLLLHMPGKVISYNLRTETFKTSVELANKKLFLAWSDNRCIREVVTFPFMETLSCL